MGGKSKSIEKAQVEQAKQQTALSQEQLALGRNYFDLAQKELARRQQLQQPAIGFASALASGDPTALTSAAAQPIAQITGAAESARANVMNNTPAGAARDYALAEIERGKSGDVAQFINQAFLGGMDTLSQLGSEALGAGLQQEGAGMRGLEGSTWSSQAAQSAYGNIQQQRVAQKAATTSMLGQLAGAAAAPFSFGVGKK